MLRPWRVLALLLLLIASPLGCAYGHFDPFHKGNAFDDSLKRFTRLIRWNQFDKASSYVDPDARQAFLEQTAALTDLRFTDYEVVDIEVRDGFKTATADVVFHAYTLSTLIERSVAVRQEWTRDEATDSWQVRPELAEIPVTFGRD